MSGRWQELDGPGKAVARTIFTALDTARSLSDGPQTDRPSASAIWSALTTGRALPAGLISDGDLEAMLSAAAMIAFPRQAAAATSPAVSQGAVVDRSTEGARIRVVPSRQPSAQSYLVISFDDPVAAAGRLLMLVEGSEPLDIALPPPVAGVIQLLLEDNDPSLAVLADEDARLYLL